MNFSTIRPEGNKSPVCEIDACFLIKVMVSCGISDNDIEVANVVLTGNSARKHILGVINVARGDALRPKYGGA